MKTVCTSILSISMALALAIALCLPATAAAADQPKGAQKLTELTRVKTKTEASSLKPGETMAIACPHCKAIWVTTVPPKGAEQLVSFQGEDKVKCPKCGSTEAFCCAAKADK
jgi:DNA-directed RNA polymerase subunit RPC12/RpoP